jgi:triacylglycerol lipase
MIHVYLVPGFFGFSALGGLKYYHHVKEVLDDAFTRLGVDAQVHRVDTLPTATIARRAQRLLEVMKATARGSRSAPIVRGRATSRSLRARGRSSR